MWINIKYSHCDLKRLSKFKMRQDKTPYYTHECTNPVQIYKLQMHRILFVIRKFVLRFVYSWVGGYANCPILINPTNN